MSSEPAPTKHSPSPPPPHTHTLSGALPSDRSSARGHQISPTTYPLARVSGVGSSAGGNVVLVSSNVRGGTAIGQPCCVSG